IQFESRIGPGQPDYLEDHVVAGHRVVPAAAYMEMALSAARAITLTTSDELPELQSIAFLQPCVFDEPMILQCVLRGDAISRSFAIYSRPESSDSGDWLLHATGEIAQPVFYEGNRSPIDLDAIRNRSASRSDASAFYGMFDENDVQFGPDFRPVTRIFHGADEAFVEITLPLVAQSEANSYQIHPITLDACLQAVVALLLNSAGHTAGVHLPAALESLQIHGDPRHLTSAYAQLHPGENFGKTGPLTTDVLGLDRDGNILVSAKGLVLRPLKAERTEVSKADSISSMFYEVDWISLEADAKLEEGSLAMQGHCVLAGDQDFVPGMAAALEAQGISCTTLPVASRGETNYDKLLQQVGKDNQPVSDFVYIAPLAVEDMFRLPADRLMKIESASVGECMRMAQALLRMEQETTARLWIVTKGAQGPSLLNVPDSALWGFARSVAAEHPEMRVARIDLDPAREASAQDLLHCMSRIGPEDELVLRGREIYVPRLRTLSPDTAKTNKAADDHSNQHLELKEAGTLEGLEIVSSNRKNPGENEVEVQVAAAGINFRDVLSVLGMYKGSSGPLGGECTGTVVRVGRNITSVQPGDEVIALGPGSFAHFMIARKELVWRKPANLSFESAVTIAIPFLTAWYALKTLAAIQPGDQVLIHAGAGGVGLAAIQIAKAAGATIFATAGSSEKRAYLTSLGVEHVMDSRSLEFVNDIQRITNGHGVDIVLNSLAGPFIDAGFATLSPGGRFIEMGMADVRSAESVASIRPDITYQAFNLAPALAAGEGFIREILDAVLKQFETQILQPLPREIFALEKAQEAFRYMAQARHIGRVVLCPPKESDWASIRNDGAYLITGGLSGIGLVVAEWLSQRGAGQVIVMGRRSPTETALDVFGRMRDAGTVISICQGDVAIEEDVKAALDEAKKFPMRGIFHCAGVLDDGALLQQEWERLRKVLSPKLQGACNLHRLTVNNPLDHFVLFSSVASVFGSPGQTNHAAANAFLDGMATLRRSRGLTALSINWGAWSETGVAVRHHVIERSKTGIEGISNSDGLRALEILGAGTRAQMVAARIDWKSYFSGSSAGAARPFLSEVRSNEVRMPRSSKTASTAKEKHSSWLPQLEQTTGTRRQDLLMRLLEERVQTTLGFSDAQEINPGQPLQELGLDSLLSIELRNSLSTSL
ncbi:MAG: SDR family NAD(P)-dependent oxidoreductase, partial [Ktedonobacteraceae bacterium]|nr:SDR family NAD(P)-dependent oxidoreductase [Ktedonobacteraceae bacterium]